MWACVAVLAGVAPLWAQPPSTGSGRAPGPFYTLTGSSLHQFDSDLDSAGSYSVSTFLLRASVAKPVSRKTILGLSLGYDYSDYPWKGYLD